MFKKVELIDVSIMFLFLVFVMLFIKCVSSFSIINIDLLTKKDEGLVPYPTISSWGRNRDFPSSYSEDEKLVLTEQKHDYERVTEEDEMLYRRFLELLKSMRSNERVVTLTTYNGDCFAKPVIVALNKNQSVTFKNTSSQSIGVGMGKDNVWDIGPNQTKTVVPNFTTDQDNQIYWGYSCSELGLAGYFVVEK